MWPYQRIIEEVYHLRRAAESKEDKFRLFEAEVSFYYYSSQVHEVIWYHQPHHSTPPACLVGPLSSTSLASVCFVVPSERAASLSSACDSRQEETILSCPLTLPQPRHLFALHPLQRLLLSYHQWATSERVFSSSNLFFSQLCNRESTSGEGISPPLGPWKPQKRKNKISSKAYPEDLEVIRTLYANTSSSPFAELDP
jgi:hypothetical protein